MAWGKLGEMSDGIGGAMKFNPGLGPLRTWGSRIGRVNDIWASPCKVTPEIWVEAFWQVLPIAIFKAIKPSPVDYLIIRFGSGHGKKRFKAWDFWGFGIGGGIHKPGWGWQVFKIGELAARTLWYIALIDAFTWGVLNWMSLAYQYSGCLTP